MEKVSFKYIGDCGGVKSLIGEFSAYFEHGHIYKGIYTILCGIQFDGIEGVYDSKLFKEVNMESSVKDVVQGEKCGKQKEKLLCKIDDGKIVKDLDVVGVIKAPIKEPDKGNADSDIFNSVLKKMAKTYEAKNHDYGNSFTKLFDKCGMTYAYGHLAEKLERIDSLRTKKNKVKSESMLDSLYDLANYSVMTIVELKKRQK